MITIGRSQNYQGVLDRATIKNPVPGMSIMTYGDWFRQFPGGNGGLNVRRSAEGILLEPIPGKDNASWLVWHQGGIIAGYWLDEVEPSPVSEEFRRLFLDDMPAEKRAYFKNIFAQAETQLTEAV